jgi:hypothetical protein
MDDRVVMENVVTAGGAPCAGYHTVRRVSAKRVCNGDRLPAAAPRIHDQ